MASATDTQAGEDESTVEVATSVAPEANLAAVQAVLSERDVRISEVLVQSPLASAATNAELMPEHKWFGEFKARFNALPQLHEGVRWADVEKSLKADPESTRKLQALDEKGHAMNVFGEENGEYVFASGWSNYSEISADHRNIAYDAEGQELAEELGYTPKGNAVDISKLMGVDLADTKFHEALFKAIAVNGWAWLKTDVATRKAGNAFVGYGNGISRGDASDRSVNGSFRAVLRVKKA